MNSNPYQAPATNLAPPAQTTLKEAQLAQLASGRRIVNLCLFSWLTAGAFHVMETPFSTPFLLVSAIASIVGMIRVAKGLDVSKSVKTRIIIGSCIPLAGLLVMIWFSGRAGKVLRLAGYQVGLFLSSKNHAGQSSFEQPKQSKNWE